MIKSIHIENFEAYIKTKFNLHKGVNVLVGESNKGKSSIIRAIKWNSKNRPKGDHFRNDKLNDTGKDKKKFTKVKIDYGTNGIVSRERNATSKNHYIINKSKQPLKALRSDVPTEVQEITRMKDVNIQGQHPTEQYFLLADKPGQVAKKFNEVSGMSVVDKSLKEINSMIRSSSSELKLIDSEIEIREKTLKELNWVPMALKLKSKIKSTKTILDDKESTLIETKITIQKIKIILKELDKLRDIVKSMKELTNIESIAREYNQKSKKIKQLHNCIKDIRNSFSSLSNGKGIKTALKRLNELDKLDSQYNKSIMKTATLKSLINSIKKANKDMNSATVNFEKLKNRYHHMLKTEQCPTCGRSGDI